MNVSKKSFIAFAVLACCFGASTLGTHVDASYGYKYTDSVRPPVETPTNDAFRANMVKQNEANNAKYAATTNTSTASAKDNDSIYYVSDLSDSFRSSFTALLRNAGFTEQQLRLIGLIH